MLRQATAVQVVLQLLLEVVPYSCPAVAAKVDKREALQQELVVLLPEPSVTAEVLVETAVVLPTPVVAEVVRVVTLLLVVQVGLQVLVRVALEAAVAAVVLQTLGKDTAEVVLEYLAPEQMVQVVL